MQTGSADFFAVQAVVGCTNVLKDLNAFFAAVNPVQAACVKISAAALTAIAQFCGCLNAKLLLFILAAGRD